MPHDEQREHWTQVLAETPDRYGAGPSAPALAAAERFAAAGVERLLGLGAGQGRDSLFFARRGIQTTALDYAPSAVEAIEGKAEAEGLGDRITVAVHDVREPLPFADAEFDACYSHMLFCMELTEAELGALVAEVRRVLRPGGLCVYTARTVDDPDYGKGVDRGEGMYELDGFVVHFFDRALVERLAAGWELLEVAEFEEGALPRRLYRVTQRKSARTAERAARGRAATRGGREARAASPRNP